MVIDFDVPPAAGFHAARRAESRSSGYANAAAVRVGQAGVGHKGRPAGQWFVRALGRTLGASGRCRCIVTACCTYTELPGTSLRRSGARRSAMDAKILPSAWNVMFPSVEIASLTARLDATLMPRKVRHRRQ
jgi:hypothetical protein